jgi:hypothetical protein
VTKAYEEEAGGRELTVLDRRGGEKARIEELQTGSEHQKIGQIRRDTGFSGKNSALCLCISLQLSEAIGFSSPPLCFTLKCYANTSMSAQTMRINIVLGFNRPNSQIPMIQQNSPTKPNDSVELTYKTSRQRRPTSPLRI